MDLGRGARGRGKGRNKKGRGEESVGELCAALGITQLQGVDHMSLRPTLGRPHCLGKGPMHLTVACT